MNKHLSRSFAFFLLCGCLARECSAGQTISLAGSWNFRLDTNDCGVAQKWFAHNLPDKILLPGSCEQRGFGFPPAQAEEMRLTHLLKYVGPAWYQREINIPKMWAGKQVELFLERCHWETTVWVDGKGCGMLNSLSAPHEHELGLLTPGRHLLTVCVDNRYKLRIGTWAHAITEDTQGNWNGIIGAIELRARSGVDSFRTSLFGSRRGQFGEQDRTCHSWKHLEHASSNPCGWRHI